MRETQFYFVSRITPRLAIITVAGLKSGDL
jgi:hypothetical protein